jgi:hypothetical protein
MHWPFFRPSTWTPRDKLNLGTSPFAMPRCLCADIVHSRRERLSLLPFSGCMNCPEFNTASNMGQHGFHLSFVSLVIKVPQSDNNLRVSLELLASHVQISLVYGPSTFMNVLEPGKSPENGSCYLSGCTSNTSSSLPCLTLRVDSRRNFSRYRYGALLVGVGSRVDG